MCWGLGGCVELGFEFFLELVPVHFSEVEGRRGVNSFLWEQYVSGYQEMIS